MESNTTTVKALKAHLALNVRNVLISTEFYRKMLGIEPTKVRSGYAKFDVQNPPLNLTLNEVSFGERGALSHLGIQVGSTEDVSAMRRKWAEAGLATRDEMQTNCCYALQDKTWGSPCMPSAEYFRRQADICVRLSLIASDDEVSNRLVNMAREYKAKGDALAKEALADTLIPADPTASVDAKVAGLAVDGTGGR